MNRHNAAQSLRPSWYAWRTMVSVVLAAMLGESAAQSYPRLETTPVSPATADSIALWLVMGRVESSCPPTYDDSCIVTLDTSPGYPPTGTIVLRGDATPPPRDTACELPVEYGPRCVLPPLPFGRYVVRGAWDGRSWELCVRYPGPGVTLGGMVRMAGHGEPATGAAVTLDRSTDDLQADSWIRVATAVTTPSFELRNVAEGLCRLVARDSTGGTDTVLYAATHDAAFEFVTGQEEIAFDSTCLTPDEGRRTVRAYRDGIEYGLALTPVASGVLDSAGGWSPSFQLHYWVTSHTNSTFGLSFSRTCRDVRCDDRSQAVVAVSTTDGVRLALDERVECLAHPRSYSLLRGDTLNEYRMVSVWAPPDTVYVRVWLYGYRASSTLELLVPAADLAPVRLAAESRRPRRCHVAIRDGAVHLALPEPGRTTVTLLALDGRVIMRLLDRVPLDAGRHRVRLPSSAWSAGLYVLAVRYGNAEWIAVPAPR